MPAASLTSEFFQSGDLEDRPPKSPACKPVKFNCDALIGQVMGMLMAVLGFTPPT